MHHLDATSIKPSAQVLALANVKKFEISTALNNGFDASASHSDATTNAKIAKFEEMQGDAA